MRGMLAVGSWRNVAVAASTVVVLTAVVALFHARASSPNVLLTDKEMRRDLRAEEGMKNFWKNLDQRDARTREMVRNLQHERFEHGVGTRYQSEQAAQLWNNLGLPAKRDLNMAYIHAHPQPHAVHAPQPPQNHITYDSRGSRAAVQQFYNGLEDHHAAHRAAIARERMVDEEKLHDLKRRVERENVVDNAQVANFWQKQAKQDIEEGQKEHDEAMGKQDSGKQTTGWFGGNGGDWDIDLGRIDLKSKGAKAQQLAQQPYKPPAATVGHAARMRSSAFGTPHFDANGDPIVAHASSAGDPNKLSRLGVKVDNTLNDVGYVSHPDAGKLAVDRAAAATPLMSVAKHLLFGSEHAQSSQTQAMKGEYGPGGFTAREQRRQERSFYERRALADQTAHAIHTRRDRDGAGADVEPTSAVEEAADRSDWRDRERVDKFFAKISRRDAARSQGTRARRAAHGQRGLRYLEAKTRGMAPLPLLNDRAPPSSRGRIAGSVRFAADSLGVAHKRAAAPHASPAAHGARQQQKAIKLAAAAQAEESEAPAAAAEEPEKAAAEDRAQHMAEIAQMPVRERAARVMAGKTEKGAGDHKSFWDWLSNIVP